MIRKLCPVLTLFAALLSFIYAQGAIAETGMAKVTIVVHGMMKSKSGAT